MPEALLALRGAALEAPDGGRVFQGLDWELKAGERWRLRAEPGSGASALLRLCAGVALPAAGSVRLAGLAPDVDRRHPFVAAGGLGWAPTDGGLAMNLSFLENVALPLRFVRGLDREAAREEASRWLDLAGLGRLKGHRPPVPAERSCWLASLARAGAKGSRLWLVDRPAGELDPAAARAARNLLAEAARDPEAAFLVVGGDWMEGPVRELALVDGRLAFGSGA